LIIDPNAVLPETIPNQGLQAVARRLAQIIELLRTFKALSLRRAAPRGRFAMGSLSARHPRILAPPPGRGRS